MVRIAIRHARPDESPQLTQLAHLAKRHWGYPPEWMDLWKDDLTISPEYIERHDAYVAEIDEEIVGVCVLEQHGDRGRLEHVWIHPMHQRQHIGQTLIETALTAAKGAGVKTVEVLSDPYAEAFYRHLGAKRTGERPAPMPGAHDRALPVLEFTLTGSG